MSPTQDMRRTHAPHPKSPGYAYCGRDAKDSRMVQPGEKPTCFHCMKRVRSWLA